MCHVALKRNIFYANETMLVVVFSKIILKISYWSLRVCGENIEGLLATPQLFARVPEAKYVTRVR